MGDELSSSFEPKENKFLIGTLDWFKRRASADILSFTTHDLHDSNHSLRASVTRVGYKIFLLRNKRLGKRNFWLLAFNLISRNLGPATPEYLTIMLQQVSIFVPINVTIVTFFI